MTRLPSVLQELAATIQQIFCGYSMEETRAKWGEFAESARGNCGACAPCAHRRFGGLADDLSAGHYFINAFVRGY